MEQTKILTARRAYEFPPDELRLTVLSVNEVQKRIQQVFGFQAGGIGTPMQTFGPVLNTMPPGVVFDFGNTQTPDGAPTPVRFLHFEAERIVIDVAGPSSAIDWTFEQLRLLLEDVRAPDGSPAIGEFEKTREYSEVVARYGFDFGELVGGPLVELAQEMFGKDGRAVLPMGVKFQAAKSDAEVEPGNIGTMGFSRGNMMEIRSGTRPQDRMFMSVAEMPTDEHLAWLEKLDERLSRVGEKA